jgi:hypothetical protein
LGRRPAVAAPAEERRGRDAAGPGLRAVKGTVVVG